MKKYLQIFNTDLGAAAQRLSDLRDVDSLNDVTYDLEVSQLMDNYNIPPEQFEQISSLVNQSMQGQGITTDDLGTIASDFETDITDQDELGVWGTGATTKEGATGRVVKEVPKVLAKKQFATFKKLPQTLFQKQLETFERAGEFITGK